MIIELRFPSITEKNCIKIHERVYDVLNSSGSLTSEDEFNAENITLDDISFSFVDTTTWNTIDYSFYDNKWNINTEWNNDFIIEIIENFLPELFWKYKIECFFFIESESWINNIIEYFEKKEKYNIEKTTP